MGKRVLDENIVQKIKRLRQTGHSLSEIRKITGKGNSTVFKYIKDVNVLPEYLESLKIKQGGSKNRSNKNWEIAKNKADKLLPKIEKNQRLILLAALYWAEGRKVDFDIINSDPELLRVFIECLRDIGINTKDIKVSLRLYEDIDSIQARKYWRKTLKINDDQITGTNIIRGKKVGKLKYGMCRVRIVKGGDTFKLIMSLVNRIKELV
jgi:DNA-binding transcriptional MerR regulator